MCSVYSDICVEGLNTLVNPCLPRGLGQTIFSHFFFGESQYNLRANLPLWNGFFDYYVIGIDRRTSDKSEEVIRKTIPAVSSSSY